MEPVIFRRANLDDISQLVNLRFLMISETSDAEPNQRTAEFESNVRDYFLESLTDKSYFGAVAELNGQLISNNGLVLYKKPPSFRGKSGIVGYVTNVYTIPEFRNRGLGHELMKLLITHAKIAGADKIHLGATDDGQSLYRKAGFKEVSFPALELRL